MYFIKKVIQESDTGQKSDSTIIGKQMMQKEYPKRIRLYRAPMTDRSPSSRISMETLMYKGILSIPGLSVNCWCGPCCNMTWKRSIPQHARIEMQRRKESWKNVKTRWFQTCCPITCCGQTLGSEGDFLYPAKWTTTTATIRRTSEFRATVAQSKMIEMFMDRKGHLHLRQPGGNLKNDKNDINGNNDKTAGMERKSTDVLSRQVTLHIEPKSCTRRGWRQNTSQYAPQTHIFLVRATFHQRKCVGSRWVEYSSLHFLKSHLVVTWFIAICMVSLILLISFLPRWWRNQAQPAPIQEAVHDWTEGLNRVPSQVLSPRTWSRFSVSARRLTSLPGETVSESTLMTFLLPSWRLRSQKPKKRDSWSHHCSRRSEK